MKTLVGSVTDQAFVLRALQEHKVDVCFHLAGQAVAGLAEDSPYDTLDTNIRGTYSILEACKVAGTVQAVVVASSERAYGNQAASPYTEKSPLLGLEPYGASKACADILTRCYYHSYALPTVVARTTNVYGPGDLNFTRLIPDCIRSVIREELFLVRGNPNTERDYLHVDDAVMGYVLLAESASDPHVTGSAFNFATENLASVLEITRRIASVSGTHVNMQTVNHVTSWDPPRRISSQRARGVLAWQPHYDLDTGLKHTFDWYQRIFGRHHELSR
ncbi:MAG: GDP-mannose 4,6-dehydratase [Coriobacteriia bacterium]|nr:GDP-mannose 4,6-dehydratase [Coriobacteriia bacterium]